MFAPAIHTSKRPPTLAWIFAAGAAIAIVAWLSAAAPTQAARNGHGDAGTQPSRAMPYQPPHNTTDRNLPAYAPRELIVGFKQGYESKNQREAIIGRVGAKLVR